MVSSQSKLPGTENKGGWQKGGGDRSAASNILATFRTFLFKNDSSLR